MKKDQRLLLLRRGIWKLGLDEMIEIVLAVDLRRGWERANLGQRES